MAEWKSEAFDLRPAESHSFEVTSPDGEPCQFILAQVGAKKPIDSVVASSLEIDGRPFYPRSTKEVASASSRFVPLIGTHFKVRVTDLRAADAHDQEINPVVVKHTMLPFGAA